MGLGNENGEIFHPAASQANVGCTRLTHQSPRHELGIMDVQSTNLQELRDAA